MPNGIINLFAVLGFIYTVIGLPCLIIVLLAIKNAERR